MCAARVCVCTHHQTKQIDSLRWPQNKTICEREYSTELLNTKHYETHHDIAHCCVEPNLIYINKYIHKYRVNINPNARRAGEYLSVHRKIFFKLFTSFQCLKRVNGLGACRKKNGCGFRYIRGRG